MQDMVRKVDGQRFCDFLNQGRVSRKEVSSDAEPCLYLSQDHTLCFGDYRRLLRRLPRYFQAQAVQTWASNGDL